MFHYRYYCIIVCFSGAARVPRGGRRQLAHRLSFCELYNILHTHIHIYIYIYIHTYTYTYIYHIVLDNQCQTSGFPWRSYEFLAYIHIYIYIYIYISQALFLWIIWYTQYYVSLCSWFFPFLKNNYTIHISYTFEL